MQSLVHALLGSLLLSTLLGCAAPTRLVTVRVTDGAGAPMPRAHVRLVAVGTSDVPLPITFETLGELLARPNLAEHALTGPEGEARLRLLAKRRHTLEVAAPPLGAEPGARRRWLLEKDGRTLTAPIDAPEVPAMRVELLR